jgi:HD-like signal output (HDOD) protein
VSLWDFLFRSRRKRARSWPSEDTAATATACAEPQPDEHPDELAALEGAPTEWWVPVGSPTGTPASPELQPEPVDDRLAAHLEQAICHGEFELPALPRVAQRALAMLKDDEVDYGRLAEVVQEDPALAARVLRVVNSAAFSRMFKVDRLEVAFAWLGCDKLRSAVLAVSLKEMMLDKSGLERSLGEEIWGHSIICAVLLGYASQQYRLPENEAFLVGLLHDIGKLAVVRLVHTYQQAHRERVRQSMYRRLCDQWHEPLGRWVAADWKLQDPLPDVIGNHHAPPAQGDPLVRYRALVQFANTCCAMLGYSEYIPYDFFNLPCMGVLGITDDPVTHEWLATIPGLVAEKTGVF